MIKKTLTLFFYAIAILSIFEIFAAKEKLPSYQEALAMLANKTKHSAVTITPAPPNYEDVVCDDTEENNTATAQETNNLNTRYFNCFNCSRKFLYFSIYAFLQISCITSIVVLALYDYNKSFLLLILSVILFELYRNLIKHTRTT